MYFYLFIKYFIYIIDSANKCMLSYRFGTGTVNDSLADWGFNFYFMLPKVNTDYIRQAQVMNI